MSVQRAALVLVPTLALVALLAAAPGWTGIASLAWIALVAIAYRYPAFGVAALGVVIPLQERIWIETVLGGATVTGYVAWAVVAVGILSVVRRGRIGFDSVAFAHLVVVLALVSSFAAGGVRVFTWLVEIYEWLLPLAVYIACRSLSYGGRGRALIVGGVSAGVIVAGTMGFMQAMTGSGPESYQVGGLIRVFGPFTHPNTLAGYLVLAIPVMAAFSMMSNRGVAGPMVWLIRTGVVFGAGALILTQSRGGWLALGLAVVFMVVMAPRPVQRVMIGAAIAVVLLAVAGGVLREVPGASRFASIAGPQQERVQVTTETWGQLERQAHWGAAWSMMRENPLFGVGAAEFNDNYREHTPEWRFRIGRGHAHNGFLHMGAQAGIPGLLAFTGWLGTILVALARRIIHTTGSDYALAIGATGAVIAYAGQSMFEYHDVMSVTILLSMIVAIALSGERDRMPRRTDDTTTPARDAS